MLTLSLCPVYAYESPSRGHDNDNDYLCDGFDASPYSTSPSPQQCLKVGAI